jgi:glucans biosynthesis protein
MIQRLGRRSLLGATAALVLARLPAALAQSQETSTEGAGLRLGPRQPFAFEALIARAAELAKATYTAPPQPKPALVQQLDYEAHGKIRFRPDHALHADGPGIYPATFFHLGRYFPKSVRMFTVSNGNAAEILYSPGYFEMPEDSVARGLPEDAGFAGFRLHEARTRDDWKTQDWIAFLGASYFRAIGALGQYGLSARGVAIDTATAKPEEFPDFVEFYIAPALRPKEPVRVYALLDGPSITGAFGFEIRRGAGVVMDIESRLFARRNIERLGIAPLTSMFWFAEYNRGYRVDWRPEVHDSDGLALWSGSGERIWRPLNNPRQTVTSSFLDESPRGFGLLQRDRELEHYLDGVNYHRRPSLWVEPLGHWGRGAVQLIEIPTDDEIHDNIVAFWAPEAPVRAGSSYDYRYRLHWLADEPYPAPGAARVVATRLGRGGEPGKPRPEGVRKFVVEFAGGPLETLTNEAKVDPVLTTSRGAISYVFAERVPGTPRWRAQFDLRASGSEPVELRGFLRSGQQTLSETWAYQYRPDAKA